MGGCRMLYTPNLRGFRHFSTLVSSPVTATAEAKLKLFA